ncbi:MAG: putative 5,10-methylene-tetrahydrofolate dehydrogenase/Methenyl tetrahydrofolate cyclohydrolase [Frankiales bacterium]|nr:putative 5,10-methylene-tetrahydrofolate dehydrogenase/Methenyl tetrahydrofolate cyclohydrolase [Frankiales bacterium]
MPALLAAPDDLPAARRLARRLGPDWVVDVLPTAPDAQTLLARIRDLGHDTVVALTDLPLGTDRRPLQAVGDGRVVVVSLPALGATGQVRRAHRLLAELAEADEVVEVAARRVLGRLRLLAGLVRENRPWRLATGMVGALAAGVSTAAFGLLSSTPWQLGMALTPWRLTLITVGAILTMVLFLVFGHGLWERGDEVVREHVRLYNATTLLTLTFGVLVLYAVGFAIVLPVVLLVLDPDVVRANVGTRPDFSDYVAIAWFIASMATVGGALGSALESDEAVRRAAYGERQRARVDGAVDT